MSKLLILLKDRKVGSEDKTKETKIAKIATTFTVEKFS